MFMVIVARTWISCESPSRNESKATKDKRSTVIQMVNYFLRWVELGRSFKFA